MSDLGEWLSRAHAGTMEDGNDGGYLLAGSDLPIRDGVAEAYMAQTRIHRLLAWLGIVKRLPTPTPYEFFTWVGEQKCNTPVYTGSGK